MNIPTATLWRGRRFTPLFVTQALGAFNDNLLKNALIVLITYRLADESGMGSGALVALAAGIFILPFCLLSATAGQLADSFDRARIAQIVKLAEIGIFTVAACGFILSSLGILLAALFMMGVHSAFFGPVKYAVLPQYLSREDLLSGNAYIGAATFLAIVLGTLAGGLLILAPSGALTVSALGVSVSVCGYIASRAMPQAVPAGRENIVLTRNIFKATSHALRDVCADGALAPLCLAISWFWLVGATYLAQLPVFCRAVLHADETVVTAALVLFALGIAAGAGISRMAGSALTWRGGAAWSAAMAAGMAVFGFDLATQIDGLRLAIDLFGLAACGGAYVVPLYTALQRKAEAAHMARTIGGLNVLNAVFMVISALIAMAVYALGYDVADLFLMVAGANAALALFGLLRTRMAAKVAP